MPQMPDFEAWAIFERMRTTLLHRTTRQLSLTESGSQGDQIDGLNALTTCGSASN
jgi:hypothetical protein